MSNGRDDLRLALGWLDHVKTKRLIRDCGPDGALCLLRLWSYAATNCPGDGILDGPDVVEDAAGWVGAPGAFLAALTKHGWLDPDGRTIHDWLEEQPYLAGREARCAQARDAGARGGRKSWEVRRAQGEPKRHQSGRFGVAEAEPNLPSPSPLPPFPSEEEEQNQKKNRSMSRPSADDVHKVPRVKTPPSAEAERIAVGLRDSIRSHTATFAGPASLDGWARDIDLALRIDGRTVEDVEGAIRFAHGDARGSFWRANVLCGKTLRKQMDRLLIQMRDDHRNGNGRPTTEQILAWGKEA